ncbi:MAG: polysaccharide biosynthesis protein [Xylanivirga thermophila]|jgi:FlaA1/EpsC-like NDP-sugar epimerase
MPLNYPRCLCSIGMGWIDINTRKRRLMMIFIDIAIINLAIGLVFFLPISHRIPLKYMKDYFLFAAIMTAVSVISSFFMGLYENMWKYIGMIDVKKIIISNFLGFLSGILGLKLFNYFIPWRMLIYSDISAMIFMVIARLILHTYYTRQDIKYRGCILNSMTNVMVIGGGDAGAMVIRELKCHPELRMNPVVIIDDDEKKHGSRIYGVPIVGGRDCIAEEVVKNTIKEIIISMPSAPKSVTREIIELCTDTRCKVKILPGVFELIDGKITINQLRDVEIEDLLGREPIEVDLDQIAGYLQHKVVMVTGGGGSIGSELCRQIGAFAPRKLIILDIYENNAYFLQQELLSSFPNLDVQVIIASVRDRQRIGDIFKWYHPEVVFHAAAHKHVPLMEENPTEAIKNNIFGTLNVAKAADYYGCKKFVLISTDKAVNPTNIMGATKRVAEMIIQSLDKKSNTTFTAVRFGNVLGSNGSVIPLFRAQIARGGPVTVTHPEITRFFMTIPEAVQLVIQAGAMAQGRELFVLDMGRPVKIDTLARNFIRLCGFEPDKDIKIVYTGLRPGEKLYEELLTSEEGLKTTRHNKIFVARMEDIEWQDFERELFKLWALLSRRGYEDVIRQMKKLVPTYRCSEHIIQDENFKVKF